MEQYSLYFGDCLVEMDNIPDNSVDLILCDLPYGATQCSWDTIIPLDSLWEQYNRVIKNNGAIVLFGQEPFSSYLRISNIKNYKYDWIWSKNRGTGFLNAKKQPLRYHEKIHVFYKKQCKYYPQKTSGHPLKTSTRKANSQTEIYGATKKDSHYSSTERYPKSVLEFSSENVQKQVHPTQKPVELLEYLIRTYTDEGDVVLDNTMGSGSTGVAAIRNNRYFIGIEQEEKYYNIAKDRIETELKNSNI